MSTYIQNAILASSGGRDIQGSSWTDIMDQLRLSRCVNNPSKSVIIFYDPRNMVVLANRSWRKLYVRVQNGTFYIVEMPQNVSEIVWDETNNRFIAYLDQVADPLGYLDVYTSTDGLNWSLLELSNINHLLSVKYHDGKYFATTGSRNNNRLCTSLDGINYEIGPTLYLQDTASDGNGTIVGIRTSNDPPLYSTDGGVSWVESSCPSIISLKSVKWVPSISRFVAVGWILTYKCLVSSDGITWSYAGPGYISTVYDFFYDTSGNIYIPYTSAVHIVDVINNTTSIVTAASGYQLLTGIDSEATSGYRYFMCGENNSFAYTNTPSSPWSSTGGPKPSTLAYSNTLINKYVASSTAGEKFYFSQDGITWNSSTTTGSTSSSIRHTRIIWDSHYNKYFSIGYNSNILSGGPSEIASSSDGASWNVLQTESSGYMRSIASNNAGTLVVVGYIGHVYYSTNGISWTSVSIPGDQLNDLNDVDWDSTSNQFIAVGRKRTIFKSSDGITWTRMQYAPNFLDIAKLGSKYVAVYNNYTQIGGESYHMSIADSIVGPWTPLNISYSGLRISSVRSNSVGTTAVAIGSYHNQIYYSTDTTNASVWNLATTPNSKSHSRLFYKNNIFISLCANADGTFLISSDGITWTEKTVNIYTTDRIYDIEYYNSYYYVVTSTGKVARSSDMTTWVESFVHPTTSGANSLIAAFGTLFVYGYNKASYKFDGTTWTTNPTADGYLILTAELVGTTIIFTTAFATAYTIDGVNIVNLPSFKGNKINQIDGKAVVTTTEGAYSWQVSTDPTVAWNSYGRLEDFQFIKYSVYDDASHISNGSHIVIYGNMGDAANYSESNVLTFAPASVSSQSLYRPSRLAYSDDPIETSYVVAGLGSSQPAIGFSANISSNWKYSPSILGLNNNADKMNLIWGDGAFLASNTQSVYISN